MRRRAFTTRLPEDDYEQLQAYVAREGCSMNDVVVEAVRDRLRRAAHREQFGFEVLVRVTGPDPA